MKYNFGEKNANSKMHAKDVRELRRLWRSGEYSQPTLARMFGISESQVFSIVHYKQWTHIDPELKGVRGNAPTSRNGMTPEDIKECRDLYAAGGWNHRKLARRYGVSKTTIGNYLRGTPKGGKIRKQHRPINKGAENGNAKLTARQVRKIRKMAESGVSYADIARQFPVGQQAIGHIVRRETWDSID